MTELTLFASTFVLVFALGLQSLNVNNGYYLAAALTSFVIGAGQMVLYKIAPHASWSEIAAYLVGGPLGIVMSMSAHPHLANFFKREKRAPGALTVVQIAESNRIEKQFPNKARKK